MSVGEAVSTATLNVTGNQTVSMLSEMKISISGILKTRKSHEIPLIFKSQLSIIKACNVY